MENSINNRNGRVRGVPRLCRFGVTSALLFIGLATLPLEADAKPTRSTNIALDDSNTVLVVANFEANSVTIFDASGASITKRNEIPVGLEPHCVAINSVSHEAFVTNSESGTVSVVSLTTNKVVATIVVGPEPRPCALTPDNSVLYVGNYSTGLVRAINPATRTIVDTIPVGGNPAAIAITDNPSRVFVTRFFAQLRPGGQEGFDDGKRGIVASFPVNNNDQVTFISLSHLANSGFTANRKNFCNLTTDPDPVNEIFCPNTTISDPNSPIIAQDPQGVFPNQFKSALIRNGKLYLPNIGAQPEPPVFFNTNVQALVHVADTNTLAPLFGFNLNAQIKNEPQNGSPLNRLFGNDIVAIDAGATGQAFYIVSRGGNYVIRATPLSNGALSINVPNVIRIQTGNIPTGIAVNDAGTFAYVNNEVNMSVSVLNLANNTVAALNVDSSTPPTPGTFEHSRLMGKLVFYTALGVPESGLNDTPLRNVTPLSFRGKQSNNAWSSCASCHDGGLADGVTWIFADGPRQTIPLDGYASKFNGTHDVRINNWSAARDSVTDFNNNSRNVQCGTGFAGGGTNTTIGCPPFGSGAPNPAIFDHGLSQGASEALDMETLWVQTVRPLNGVKAATAVLEAGAIVFGSNCASCHGGAKWTKSQVIYLNNPTLDKAFTAGGSARDPGLTITANQIVSYSDPKVDASTLKFLDDVGTFNPANPIEIRQNGQAPLGALGFNVPSLLGVANSAPYFHNGSAQTLSDVFVQHELPGGGTIQTRLNSTQRSNLNTFLFSIDGRSVIIPNDTDSFKDPT